MEEIICLYRQFSGAEREVNTDNHGEQEPQIRENLDLQSQFKQFSCPKTNAELMEIAQRYLDETNYNQLSLSALEKIEEELDVSLRQTMSKKAKFIMDAITRLRAKAVKMDKEEARGKGADNYNTYQPTRATQGLATDSVDTSQGIFWEQLQHLHEFMDT